jgi:hypothetical protein
MFSNALCTTTREACTAHALMLQMSRTLGMPAPAAGRCTPTQLLLRESFKRCTLTYCEREGA